MSKPCPWGSTAVDSGWWSRLPSPSTSTGVRVNPRRMAPNLAPRVCSRTTPRLRQNGLRLIDEREAVEKMAARRAIGDSGPELVRSL